MRVAIIGAGVSGLAAARFLNELDHEVHVFEASPAPFEGLMETRRVEGFAFDVGGGHIIYSRDPWFNAFIRELYEGGGLLTHERRTKIFYKGRFVKYPFENGLSDLPPEVNYECLLGFIEAYMRRDSAEPPKNFREWIDYRMGEGMARHFMVPYNEKIWNSDLTDMGVEWVDGRVPEAPLEDVLRASMGLGSEGYTHQSLFAYPEEGGIQDLIRRIGEPVMDRVRFGRPVTRVARLDDGRFDVDGERFDRVISTAPLDRAPGLVEGFDEEGAAAARSLRHVSVTTFLFGLDAKAPMPYSWIYLPFPEDGAANRLTCLSNYSPRNAPEGKASLLAEVTHQGPLEVTEAYVADLKGALARAGLLEADRVIVEAHASVDYAYIYYDLGFGARRRRALDAMARTGVLPLGRFGGYNYFNVDHCVLEARDLVNRLHGESKRFGSKGPGSDGQR